jgi:O-Antigen ligase
MRRPVWVLHVLIVGLALHNFVIAELWAAGLRGKGLEVVSAWKEVLLAFALLLVLSAHGSLRFRPMLLDWLALVFGAFVVVYALIPQHVLGGEATHHGVVLAARDDLVPVAAYFLGRGLALRQREFQSLARTVLATAVGVAAFGIVDVYAIPLSWWRHSGAPGWFTHQLGFSYFGLSGLPENFVYNTGNGHPLRRLVSTFLSPLATSYLLVAALIICAAWLVMLRPRGRALLLWAACVALFFVALLLTHSRSSYLALAFGLVVFAVVRGSTREKLALVGAGLAVVLVGAAFVKAYPHIGPKTSFTATELHQQETHAHTPGAGAAVSGQFSDASTTSHWQSLEDGVRTVVRHPQGYGLGNAGSTAVRTCGNKCLKAGESTYTQVGVEVGLVGALVFVAWTLLLALRTLPCIAWVGASLLAMLALALQTDMIGVPWVMYVLFALAGGSHRLRNDSSPDESF